MDNKQNSKPVTVSNLTEALNEFGGKLERKIEEKIGNQILESEERIMKELKDTREEFDVHQY